MKTIKTAAAIMLAASLFFLACDKNKQKLPVDFKYVLLDTLGNEKTVFSPGENIIFSFQVINESDEDLSLENFFPNNDFFRVYSPNTNEGTLDYDIPYEAVILIYAFKVPANGILKIEYPWQGGVFWNEEYPILSNQNSNPNLPRGNFYTEFSQSFKIGDIKTEEKHFKINFTIE